MVLAVGSLDMLVVDTVPGLVQDTERGWAGCNRRTLVPLWPPLVLTRVSFLAVGIIESIWQIIFIHFKSVKSIFWT